MVSTLQLITDQFGDMGRKVAYDGPTHAMATVRPDDLHRAVTNLVENAVKFWRRSRDPPARLAGSAPPSTSRTTAPAFRMR
jgi:hypothetical protein